MDAATLIKDTIAATAAGYAGTKAMEQFNMRTYRLQPEDDRQRDQRARPGPPFVLAADNLLSRIAGIELDDDDLNTVGQAFHYLAGLSWMPVYIALRRTAGWRPVTAGLATGASMSLILDETITPAIGASAPNPDYPASTHLRAFAAHLVYGLTAAAVVDVAWKLLKR